MTDTPKHVQDLQLQLWMAKSPSERLYQALKNNEEFFLFSKLAREAMQKVREHPKEK